MPNSQQVQQLESFGSSLNRSLTVMLRKMRWCFLDSRSVNLQSTEAEGELCLDQLQCSLSLSVPIQGMHQLCTMAQY